VVAAAGCTNGVGDRTREQGGTLTIATGSSLGVYHQYASEYARLLSREMPKLELKIVTTAGSVENLQRLSDGRAQLGFATADTAFQAFATPTAPSPAGSSPSGTPRAPGACGSPGVSAGTQKLRAVARIYDEYIHVVVRADSKVSTLRDLRGLRVSTGAECSSTEVVAGRLLDTVGLRADRDLRRSRVGLIESATMLRDGRLDAFFWSGGLPTKGITGLSKDVKIRLLKLDDQVNPLRATFPSIYRRAVVPAATYGVPETVTIGVPNYLLVSSDMDKTLVYQLTRVLFRQREELAKRVASGQTLDPRSAISTLPIPLHPGAEQYYQDHKP
jgi:TRAP-type uncharacterized transport system substrate-binding protein